jgi:hypothetical protein
LLHIGTHKTGSTSLQHYFASQAALLRRQGLLYPTSARPRRGPTAGHHLASRSLRGIGARPEAVWPGLMREIDGADQSNVLLSSEGFEKLAPSQIRQLRAYLADSSVRVIVYLRNPCRFMAALFKQKLKLGKERGDYAGFVRRNAHRCDYARLLGDWAAVFGRDAVLPRLYDKAVHGRGLLADFLSLLPVDGIDPHLAGAEAGWRNQSPSEGMLHVLRRLSGMRWLQASEQRAAPAAMALRRGLILLDRLDRGRCGALLAGGAAPLIHPEGIALSRAVCEPAIDALFPDWLRPEDRRWLETSITGQ